MARPREFDHEEVLQKAMEVFWEKGYEGTSVQDLVERAEVNRFSLYATFQNKHQLFLSALDHYRDHMVSRLLGEVECSSEGFSAIRDYLQALVDLSPEHGFMGCLMVNSATEVAPHDPESKERIAAHFERMKKAFHRALEISEKNGELIPGQNIEALADCFVAVALGLAVVAKVSAPQEVLQNQIDIALSTVRLA